MLNKSPCSYSHLGSSRPHISKGIAQAGVSHAIIKKIDKFGEDILNECCVNLRKFGADQKLIDEFVTAALELKLACMDAQRSKVTI